MSAAVESARHTSATLGLSAPRAVPAPVLSGRRRADSPPRASFRLLNAGGPRPAPLSALAFLER